MTAGVRTIEERGGAWVRLVLDSSPGNLISMEMVRALAAALAAAAGRRRKWLTLEGSGDDFSFGARVQEHVPGIMEHVLPATHALIRQILAMPAPTAALVHGRCLGGGFELVLACDVVIASQDATLGLPEINLGAIPPAGAALLPLRIGASRSAVAVLTGVVQSAASWHAAGLIHAVTTKAELVELAGEWFDTHLAPRSAVALAAAADASRLALRSQAVPAIAAAERLYLERVLPTRDASEGVRAFLEKRTPEWTDQ